MVKLSTNIRYQLYDFGIFLTLTLLYIVSYPRTKYLSYFEFEVTSPAIVGLNVFKKSSPSR